MKEPNYKLNCWFVFDKIFIETFMLYTNTMSKGMKSTLYKSTYYYLNYYYYPKIRKPCLKQNAARHH